MGGSMDTTLLLKIYASWSPIIIILINIKIPIPMYSIAMISTQIQALFLEAFEDSDLFRQSLRLDILAVMVRDPAVKSYTDVILYFKGNVSSRGLY
jgi:hypothetical protein